MPLITVWLEVRVLPGPPRTLVLTEISRGLPNTRDLARAFRLAFSLHQEKGPLSGNLGPCVSGLEKTFPGVHVPARDLGDRVLSTGGPTRQGHRRGGQLQYRVAVAPR